MSRIVRRSTRQVRVGPVLVGGDAPVVVQSMTNTDTVDITATVRQVQALAEAGSELVRLTVNTLEAAAAVPRIRERLERGQGAVRHGPRGSALAIPETNDHAHPRVPEPLGHRKSIRDLRPREICATGASFDRPPRRERGLLQTSEGVLHEKQLLNIRITLAAARLDSAETPASTRPSEAKKLMAGE